MTAPAPRDVVEVLLDAHVATRQMVSLASALCSQSCTAQTRETAQSIADFVEWVVPLHCADEDVSLAPRLAGRDRAVDVALRQMHREHLALEAPLSRVRLLCSMVARDVTRMHALRFELARAAEELSAQLERHQAYEESTVIPALKRLLYVDELESIAAEMQTRRAAQAAA